MVSVAEISRLQLVCSSAVLNIQRIFVHLEGRVGRRTRITFTRVGSPIVYKTLGEASSGKYFLGERCLHATIGFAVSQRPPGFLYPSTRLVYTCNSTQIPATSKSKVNASTSLRCNLSRKTGINIDVVSCFHPYFPCLRSTMHSPSFRCKFLLQRCSDCCRVSRMTLESVKGSFKKGARS